MDNICKCGQKTVLNGLCKDCFIEYFENKVLETIKKFSLIDENDKIVVAVSGGKDSLTTLYILNKYFKNVSALAIDEGINNYREFTLKNLKYFCSKYKIHLTIKSFKKEFGKTLDEMLKTKKNPCTVCGILRRYLLNQAEGTKVVSGHNLDDESQALLMNLMKSNLEFCARLGPKSGIGEEEGFIQRIKPLYFMKEKEVMLYTLLKKFPVDFNECPYSHLSFRSHVRDFLNDLEYKQNGTKEKIIKNFIKILPKLKVKKKSTINKCIKCGSNSKGKICRACEICTTL